MIRNPLLPQPVDQTGVQFFQNALPAAVGLGFVIGAIIFFFMLVVGAIQWIFSGGDKQSLESAGGKLSNALVGILILFAAFAVINLIEIFFGITIMALDIGPLVIQ